MSTADVNEWADVLNRVTSWPSLQRIALARKILESLEAADVPASPVPARTRGVSAAEVQGLLRTDRPPPDDETVGRWIDEHRMEKYGR